MVKETKVATPDKLRWTQNANCYNMKPCHFGSTHVILGAHESFWEHMIFGSTWECVLPKDATRLQSLG